LYVPVLNLGFNSLSVVSRIKATERRFFF